MSSALSATAAAPSTLPDILPVFPLPGAILLPRARLPLNVFEPRYLAIVEDALAEPCRMIGIVQPNAPENQNIALPPLYHVGCAGRIVSFEETEDGRYQISLLGISRFEVGPELTADRPYRRVRPQWQKFAHDLTPESGAEIDRKRLLNVLQLYFRQQKIDPDWKAVQNAPDEVLVSSLVMICPLPVNERQALLEAPGLAARAALLITLLEMALLPQANENESAARH